MTDPLYYRKGLTPDIYIRMHPMLKTLNVGINIEEKVASISDITCFILDCTIEDCDYIINNLLSQSAYLHGTTKNLYITRKNNDIVYRSTAEIGILIQLIYDLPLHSLECIERARLCCYYLYIVFKCNDYLLLNIIDDKHRSIVKQ